jgi:uncharacterized protein (TIGR00730 family)
MTGKQFNSICVYCGSSDSIHPSFLTAARQLGMVLAKHSIRLIYGAGKTGLMGAVAGGALAAGGQVTGVVPESLNQSQLIAGNLSSLEICSDIQSRKKRMHDLADALIALPGGFGTLDELFEALTWAQIGLHQKPIGILNVDGYFEPMFMMIEHAAVEGFIYPEHKDLLVSDSDPEGLLRKLESYVPPKNLTRWVSREKTD